MMTEAKGENARACDGVSRRATIPPKNDDDDSGDGAGISDAAVTIIDGWCCRRVIGLFGRWWSIV